MKRGVEIDSLLKPLSEVSSQAVLTNSLQVADLMEWVVAQIGRCRIWQSSFSISEEYLRRLFFLKGGGELIEDITLVLDFKATNMTVKLWVFIDQLVKKCFLADNHSKVLLFKSDSGKMVSIVTSQNLTRGNRYESCVITTDPQIFNSLFSSFMEMVDNYSVPLSEIMEKVSDFTVLTDGVSERDS